LTSTTDLCLSGVSKENKKTPETTEEEAEVLCELRSRK
jgi:hypothetical protein